MIETKSLILKSLHLALIAYLWIQTIRGKNVNKYNCLFEQTVEGKDSFWNPSFREGAQAVSDNGTWLKIRFGEAKALMVTHCE